MFIDDLVTLLVEANLGTPGTSIFWSSGAVLPAKSTTGVNLTGFITLQETGGMEPILMHTTTPGWIEQPTAQIVARANSWGPARLLAKNAWGTFVRRRSLTINGTWYISIDVAQGPTDLGADDVGRVRVSFNVRAKKYPEGVSYV